MVRYRLIPKHCIETKDTSFLALSKCIRPINILSFFLTLCYDYFLNIPLIDWTTLEQFSSCSLTCVPGFEKLTQVCCDTGLNAVCSNLPWTSLKAKLGTCVGTYLLFISAGISWKHFWPKVL
jgi:hypothetical protein